MGVKALFFLQINIGLPCETACGQRNMKDDILHNKTAQRDLDAFCSFLFFRG